MADRPIILFPEAQTADREKRRLFVPPPHLPSFSRQYDRLLPKFSVLQNAFQQKHIAVQGSPIGINPEFALVFEVIGSVDNFYNAVKRVPGFEWMFDIPVDDIQADEDFYSIDDHGERNESDLSGRLYCIMSNKEAIDQLLSLWQRHQAGEEEVFKRNFSGLRDIFIHIKNIRPWDEQDRIFETHAIEYWKEQLSIGGDQPVPFEIELFYRSDEEKRNNASFLVMSAVEGMGGSILKECMIGEISYHCILVELPRNSIQELVDNYTSISLVKIDDIMFFRPTCQSVFINSGDSLAYTETQIDEIAISGEPVIAIFDGMPIQNHPYLAKRLIVDDPDGFENNYESKYRFHGTAMASLIIHGDLARSDIPLSRPIYLRPVLRPNIGFNDISNEIVPQNEIFIDLIHRAVKRMYEGDGSDSPMAPTVKVINFSIGDPVRQFINAMSPLARLLDWLSYKYKILFIVSAGNHNEVFNVPITFSEFKMLSLEDRGKCVFSSLQENIRNLKVLSPAESLNALSVGAIYADGCNVEENDRLIFAVEDGIPSPISSFGHGYNSRLTPDLFYYGGRKYLVDDIVHGKARWAFSNRAPGCKVAAPDGNNMGIAYSFGTSDAAAQLSHEAGKCYEILDSIFLSETAGHVPHSHAAALIKAMLVHGASWDNVKETLAKVTGTSINRLGRWLGNGIPDISRVEECAKNRITLIGIGDLKIEGAHLYKLPIPIDFSRLIKRRLTITLAYLSPIDIARQKYRSTQIWFNIEDGAELFPERQNTHWQYVRKGTLQHEIFTGENTLVWNDKDVIIKVNCKPDAGKNKDRTPYAIFVTFEVAEGLDIDVYTGVAAQIRPQQAVPVFNA